MTKMLQSGIGRAVLAAVVVAVTVVATTTSRAARAARSASRLAVFALAATAAVFAAIALTGDNAAAQGSGQVKSLSVGGDHACALTRDDTILCWGRNDEGQTDAPTQHNFNYLALDENYSCGLPTVPLGFPIINEDENCWGEAPSAPFVIYPSAEHNCIVHDDSISCSGRNYRGQTSVRNDLQYLNVAVGREHTCAVTIEMTGNQLRCWGFNNLGQSSPPTGSDYIEVFSNGSANFNCALTNERRVRCWGDNQYGQLNVPAAIAAPPLLEFQCELCGKNDPFIRDAEGVGPTSRLISARQNQSIDIVLPPATGGSGGFVYDISNFAKDSLPQGLVFDATTRKLSGQLLDSASIARLSYSALDTSGRVEHLAIALFINGPAPAGYPTALTTTELGIVDRGITRCGIWSEESLQASTDAGPIRPFEYYTFNITSQAILQIDLESEDANTKLLLSGYETGWIDDDGGEGTNARIARTLDPGRYVLYAQTSPNSDQTVGAYALRIAGAIIVDGSPQEFPDYNAPARQRCPSNDSSADEEDTSSADEEDLDIATAGRIVARRLDDGRIEFGWHIEDGDRVLPRLRYLPSEPPTGRWLNSSEIIVEGVNLGRINVRVDAETGRIEFAFTPAGGERILPQSRYFPSNATPGRWLRSTLIEPGG